MRAPSKRVTFLFAFLAANFLLWFPFASSLDEEPTGAETEVVEEDAVEGQLGEPSEGADRATPEAEED